MVFIHCSIRDIKVFQNSVFYFSFFLIRTVVGLHVQCPFNIALNNPEQYTKLCKSLSTDLLYLLFYYTSPGTKSLSELKVTYSVFVCKWTLLHTATLNNRGVFCLSTLL